MLQQNKLECLWKACDETRPRFTLAPCTVQQQIEKELVVGTIDI